MGQHAWVGIDDGCGGEAATRQNALPFAMGVLGLACFWRMLRYDAVRALFPFDLLEQTGVSWYYYGLLAAVLVVAALCTAVRPLGACLGRTGARVVLASLATMGAVFLSLTVEVDAAWIAPLRWAAVVALAVCFAVLTRGWLWGCRLLLRADMRGGGLAVALSSMVALLFSMAFYVDPAVAAVLRALCPLGSAVCLNVLEKGLASPGCGGSALPRVPARGVWGLAGFVALCFVIASVIRHTGPVGQERVVAAPELIGNYFFTLLGGMACAAALLFVGRFQNLIYSLVLIPVAMLSLGYFSFDALSQQVSMALCFVLMACCIGALVVLLVRGGQVPEVGDAPNHPDVVDAMARRFGLTPKEAVIAGFLVRGYTSPAIAKAQGLSLSTVQTHARSIYTKAGVHSRQELIEVVEGIEGR